jgi:hypothetical protein
MEISEEKKMIAGKAAMAKLFPPIAGPAIGPKMKSVPAFA